jgi:octaheme c-type cytochrome (tetrathionate reductase family)
MNISRRVDKGRVWVFRKTGNILMGFSLLNIFVLSCTLPGPKPDDPWAHFKRKPPKTTHTFLFKVKQFPDGPSVTRACLYCHPDSAAEVMKTSHWTWLSAPELIPGHDRPVQIGKRNAINNFCISIEGNWPKCTTCHAGYGWKDANFDFKNQEHVDCLVCHDQSGQYAKGENGEPAQGVDLLAAAKSVGRPTRNNCGLCHFNGGGGDAVKHGDLDGSLSKPVEREDVHMGRHDFQCIDCHRTVKHNMAGRMMSVSVVDTIAVKCTDCHSVSPHGSDRLNDHVQTVACQTCHLPEMAIKEPTKVAWDWSTAGRDVAINEPHKYLKIKGSFIYERQLEPSYYWFNGNSMRYLKGDKVNPEGVTHINYPLGSIDDQSARIWPFKVHLAKQPYDVKFGYLLVPKTVGEHGFWTDFDWNEAARLGSEASGLPFSGELGFTETDMHWSLSHMIAPKERALQCVDCHGVNGRLDWKALGYDSDPAFAAGKRHRRQAEPVEGAGK